eukprot:GAHX01001220.1.p1 GENE.GAHX01001220.1~~GAHX01001220.1.p1  ORF type:complete len:255 (-),score=55.47 GAHX01001220.1:33-797(-)
MKNLSQRTSTVLTAVILMVCPLIIKASGSEEEEGFYFEISRENDKCFFIPAEETPNFYSVHYEFIDYEKFMKLMHYQTSEEEKSKKQPNIIAALRGDNGKLLRRADIDQKKSTNVMSIISEPNKDLFLCIGVFNIPKKAAERAFKLRLHLYKGETIETSDYDGVENDEKQPEDSAKKKTVSKLDIALLTLQEKFKEVRKEVDIQMINHDKLKSNAKINHSRMVLTSAMGIVLFIVVSLVEFGFVKYFLDKKKID